MSSWTEDEWDAFVAMLRHGFASKSPLTVAEEAVYRILLAPVQPAAAVRALQALVLKGQALRPKPGELVAAIRSDSSVPTADEVLELLYGRRGLFSLQPPPRGGRWGEGEYAAERARLEAAFLASAHPLVGAFVGRIGARLRDLDVADPKEGHWRRDEVREAWKQHLEACEGREVEALAAGSGADGLRQLDPMALLGLKAPGELGTGA